MIYYPRVNNGYFKIPCERFLKSLVKDFQSGSMTYHEIRTYLSKDRNMHVNERRAGLKIIRDLNVGLKLLKKLRAGKNGHISKVIPKEDKWRKVVLMDEKAQAEWYINNRPEIGTLEYNMFKRLCRAFGLEGNKFYYWIRKLS
jgi:hypothetical protein